MKLNSIGDLEWSKAIGGTGSELGRSVKQTEDGGYRVGGFTTSYGNASGGNVYLVKPMVLGKWNGRNVMVAQPLIMLMKYGRMRTGATQWQVPFGVFFQAMWLDDAHE